MTVFFNENPGDFHTWVVHLELKKDAVPKHHEAFPVPKIYDICLKKEVD